MPDGGRVLKVMSVPGIEAKILDLGPIYKISYDNLIRYDTIRYDTRCYFNVRSKADISQLNLPHGTDN